MVAVCAEVVVAVVAAQTVVAQTVGWYRDRADVAEGGEGELAEGGVGEGDESCGRMCMGVWVTVRGGQRCGVIRG